MLVMLGCDENGFFQNPTSKAYLRPPWAEIVEAVVAAGHEYMGDHLHSVYVRGSVADGTAVLGQADVDLVAILHRDTTVDDRVWREATQSQFRGRVPPECEVDLDLVSARQVFDSAGDVLWQFALATQGLCVFGDDITAVLPRFRPTRDLAARLASGTRRHVEGARIRLAMEDAPSGVLRICKRSAKYLLRSAAVLVMEAEGYTRDLREAARIFVRHYPSKTNATQWALRLATTPTHDPLTVRAFLDHFGDWVSDEVEQVLLTSCSREALDTSFAQAPSDRKSLPL
jgi:hypothetical protein